MVVSNGPQTTAAASSATFSKASGSAKRWVAPLTRMISFSPFKRLQRLLVPLDDRVVPLRRRATRWAPSPGPSASREIRTAAAGNHRLASGLFEAAPQRRRRAGARAEITDAEILDVFILLRPAGGGVSLSVRNAMLNRSSPVRASATASSGVSRSNNKVASCLRCISPATSRFRGLERLLPLPCAKTTSPWLRPELKHHREAPRRDKGCGLRVH